MMMNQQAFRMGYRDSTRLKSTLRYGEMLPEWDEDLWRFCVEQVSRTVGNRQQRLGRLWAESSTEMMIRLRLLDAFDDVPDLQVLIGKVKPDMLAFAESRMTNAEKYRW